MSRNEAIGAVLNGIGASDLSRNFTTKNGEATWIHTRDTTTIFSKVDYCFVTDRKSVTNFQHKQPRGFDSDHKALVVTMRTDRETEHKKYRKK